MSYYITKTVFTGNGERQADLFINPIDKKLYFKQYFETHGFMPLIFDSFDEILKFLKETNQIDYLTYDNFIVFKKNEADNFLSYFGTIFES